MKIKGIKRAIGDFNNWDKSAIVYFDKSDNTVWTKVYASSNEWEEYHSDTIIQVAKKNGLNPYKLTMKELSEMVESRILNKGDL